MLIKENLIAFWVGFLDGDGFIQVNHWKKKILQFRFVIKIKNTEKNKEMCQLFAKALGGAVKIEKPHLENVLWVEDHQRNIWKLLKLLEKTPPLTKRLQLQILFLKKSKENGILWMLENRKFKYSSLSCFYKKRGSRESKTHEMQFTYKGCNYWHFWLCGFIEARGCFSIKENGNIGFSVGQKYEYNLLCNIRNYFGASNRVLCRKKTQDFFFLQVYRKSICKNIVSSIDRILIGEKQKSFSTFKQHFL